MKKVFKNLSLILLVGIIFVFATACQKEADKAVVESEKAPDGMQISQDMTPIPDAPKTEMPEKFPEFSAKDFSGEEFSSEEFKNYDATLLSFWFTGCKGCAEEFPDLEEFYKELKEKNVNVIGVCVDSSDSEGMFKKAKDILEKSGVTYRNLNIEPGNEEMDKFISEIMAFPTNILVDSEGKIYEGRTFGSVNEKNKNEILKAIDDIKMK